MSLQLRPARREDAPAMVAMINAFADRQLMLPRRTDDIRRNLPDWLVALEPQAGGRETIIGCAALAALTPKLAELRSVAVRASHHGQGVGSLLVSGLVTLARERSFDQVCALTLREAFFHRLGFEIVDRWRISPKLWQECIYCPKFDRCDEVAVLKSLRVPSSAAEGVPASRSRQPLARWPSWQPLRLAFRCQPMHGEL